MCTGSSPRQSGVIDRPPVDDCVGVGGVVKPIWVVLRLRSKTPQGEMAWLGLGDLLSRLRVMISCRKRQATVGAVREPVPESYGVL